MMNHFVQQRINEPVAMLIVLEDELDFADEYDPMHEVYCHSKSFTGIAKALP